MAVVVSGTAVTGVVVVDAGTVVVGRMAGVVNVVAGGATVDTEPAGRASVLVALRSVEVLQAASDDAASSRRMRRADIGREGTRAARATRGTR
ncbi:MAG: hypothetical protein ACR2HP_16050 [Ilumatobacteraceae bacterium]